MKKKNVIAFSLWGNKPLYTDGVAANLKLASKIYPGWEVILYVDDSVDVNFLKKIHSEFSIEIRKVTDKRGSKYGAFWRLFVNDDCDVDRYIIRDLDSRLNWREKAAVDEWLSSDKQFHIMRDHPHHRFQIQCGMWGGTANIFKMIPLVSQWKDFDTYCCDQYFLGSIVYPIIKNNSMVHDPYFEKIPFPKHKTIEDGGTFVGQIYIDNIPQTP